MKERDGDRGRGIFLAILNEDMMNACIARWAPSWKNRGVTLSWVGPVL